jgi:Tfp pilus assembly protein PilE
MRKIKNNQKGFGAVEGLLVLVIIVLICVVGYMVYKNHHKATASASTTAAKTSTSNSAKSTAAAPNPYAGWNTYTASLKPVSFKYPANWTVDNSAGNAPVKTSSSESITIDAPERSISGTNYQFSLTFSISTPSPESVPTSVPVYASTKLTDSNFPKTLYALFIGTGAPSGSVGYNEASTVEVSATNYKAGGLTDGNDTIPTSTVGQDINIGGNYTKTNDSGLSYDDSLGYFTTSEFASLQEVQQAEQIFSSLTQN